MQNKNKKREQSTGRDEHHHLVLREELKLGNLITWLGLASGFGSILLSITEKFFPAAMLIIISLICDFFDGRMARKAHKATAFGTELDSLTDIMSFGMAPMIFGFMQYATPFAIIAYLFNISAGVFRLARYNILHREHYYVGMPITWNAVIIFLTVLFVPHSYWPYAYILSAVLMASPFKIRKV
jgi:CDP-diacylglycerol--serine O-phosphatidyltransferase